MNRTLTLLTLAAALTCGQVWLQLSNDNVRMWSGIYNDVLDKTAAEPYRFRVLAPLAHEGLERMAGFTATTTVMDGIGFAAMLFGAMAWFACWTSDNRAFAGACLLAALYPIHWLNCVQPTWTVWEIALGCYALKYAHHGNWLGALALSIIATINRETGIVIALGCVAILGRDAWLIPAASIATHFGLRYWIGEAAPQNTLAERMAINLDLRYAAQAGVMWTAFLAPWLAFGKPRLGGGRSWLLMLSGAYLAVMAVHMLWQELRPLALVLAAPMMLGPNEKSECFGDPRHFEKPVWRRAD